MFEKANLSGFVRGSSTPKKNQKQENRYFFLIQESGLPKNQKLLFFLWEKIYKENSAV